MKPCMELFLQIMDFIYFKTPTFMMSFCCTHNNSMAFLFFMFFLPTGFHMLCFAGFLKLLFRQQTWNGRLDCISHTLSFKPCFNHYENPPFWINNCGKLKWLNGNPHCVWCWLWLKIMVYILKFKHFQNI